MTRGMRTSIAVEATPQRIWEVLTDVPSYPDWTPVMISAEGTFDEGGRVVFGFPPLHPLLRSTVPARVQEMTPCRRLRYEMRFARWGLPGLLDAEVMYTIDVGPEGVRLWVELESRGLLVLLMIRSLSPDETPTFGFLPDALKARIERRDEVRHD